MEAWIASDSEALARYYGQGFHQASLPNRLNLEDEPKTELYSKLVKATRNSQKGAYNKIQHASAVLAIVAVEKVRELCPRFETFTNWLSRQISTA